MFLSKNAASHSTGLGGLSSNKNLVLSDQRNRSDYGLACLLKVQISHPVAKGRPSCQDNGESGPLVIAPAQDDIAFGQNRTLHNVNEPAGISALLPPQFPTNEGIQIQLAITTPNFFTFSEDMSSL